MELTHVKTQLTTHSGPPFRSGICVPDVRSMERVRASDSLDVSFGVAHSEPNSARTIWNSKRLRRWSQEVRAIKYTVWLMTAIITVFYARNLWRFVATLIGGYFLTVTVGCKYLTPQTENELSQVGVAVLCSIENLEIDDPALNALCQKAAASLPPEHAAAIRGVIEKNRAARERYRTRGELLLGKDGGQ